MESLNVGLGSFVSAAKVVAVISPESAPVKRMVQEAKERGDLIDSTYGRRTRAVLVLEGNKIMLSSIQPSTIMERNSGKTKAKALEENS